MFTWPIFWLHRLEQAALSPGATAELTRRLAACLPPDATVLDIGCGPRSLLTPLASRVVGIDVSRTRLRALARDGAAAVCASGSVLPFADASFDIVWSAGLLHHLPDSDAAECARELLRVVRPEGQVVLFDSVTPRTPWHRPLAWIIRRLDRGRHVRAQAALYTLLPDRDGWSVERFTYAHTGLEGVWCTYAKPAAAPALLARAAGWL